MDNLLPRSELRAAGYNNTKPQVPHETGECNKNERLSISSLGTELYRETLCEKKRESSPSSGWSFSGSSLASQIRMNQSEDLKYLMGPRDLTCAKNDTEDRIMDSSGVYNSYESSGDMLRLEDVKECGITFTSDPLSLSPINTIPAEFPGNSSYYSVEDVQYVHDLFNIHHSPSSEKLEDESVLVEPVSQPQCSQKPLRRSDARYSDSSLTKLDGSDTRSIGCSNVLSEITKKQIETPPRLFNRQASICSLLPTTSSFEAKEGPQDAHAERQQYKTQNNDSVWYERLRELQQFKEEHGHANVSLRSSAMTDLQKRYLLRYH